jgi:hypothetical protein
MDMMQPGHGPEEDEDDAARAFEALRGEVAALRRGIELVYRQAQQVPAAALDAPDYSPTLGAIAQELRAFGKRLDGMEAHPALKLTPAAYATQVTEGVRRVEGEAARSLTHAQGRFSDGLHELRSLIGSAHSQFVQQRREWIAVAIGAALGFVVWWPLAFLTPWGGGHWLAATLIGGGRWGAGQTLIEEANPAVWERMVRLYRACPVDTTTELCEAALAVRTIPPGQAPTESEGTRAAPLGVPPPSRGRASRQ